MPMVIDKKKKEYAKRYYLKNQEKIKKRVRDWRRDNRLRYLKNGHDYYQKNKDKFKKYSEVNSEYKKEWMCDYYNKNKEYLSQCCRDYYWNHKEEINQRCREYYNRNRQVILKRLKKYHSERLEIRNDKRRLRYSVDIFFRINSRMSNAIRQSLKYNYNDSHWESFIGYTLQDLMQHLESQFRDGMTWQNYGKDGWHIDHIKPICSFKFNSINNKQFRQCWSLNNLQPLWEFENLSKNRREVENAGRRQGGRYPVAVKSPDI